MLPNSIYRILLIAVVLVVSGCNNREGVYSPTTKNILSKAFRPIEIKSGDWPWWRGPTHDGIAEKQSVPQHWNEEPIGDTRQVVNMESRAGAALQELGTHRGHNKAICKV